MLIVNACSVNICDKQENYAKLKEEYESGVGARDGLGSESGCTASLLILADRYFLQACQSISMVIMCQDGVTLSSTLSRLLTLIKLSLHMGHVSLDPAKA